MEPAERKEAVNAEARSIEYNKNSYSIDE